jgi:hypothetical protein
MPWNTPWCCSEYKLRQAGGRIRVIPMKHGQYFPMKTSSDAASLVQAITKRSAVQQFVGGPDEPFSKRCTQETHSRSGYGWR